MFAAAALSVFVTASIVYILVYDSVLFFRQVSIIDFLTDTEWTPVFDNPRFGIMTLVSGTLMTTLDRPHCRRADRDDPRDLSERVRAAAHARVHKADSRASGRGTDRRIRLFRAVLSYSHLPAIHSRGCPTFNLLVPGIVIGIMILPYIVSVAEDAMRAVPDTLREGAYALGFTRLQTSLRVVIPGAFSGVTAAYILGMSRAVGETMVVAIAAGQQARIAYDPLEGAATITAYIVQISLGDLPHNSLAYLTIFAAGLTLFLITLMFNLIAFWLRKKYREVY